MKVNKQLTLPNLIYFHAQQLCIIPHWPNYPYFAVFWTCLMKMNCLSLTVWSTVKNINATRRSLIWRESKTLLTGETRDCSTSSSKTGRGSLSGTTCPPGPPTTTSQPTNSDQSDALLCCRQHCTLSIFL